VPVSDVCACRENAHEYVVVADLGLVDVLELQDVGRAVPLARSPSSDPPSDAVVDWLKAAV
jgi:hypothetical protein